MSAYASNFCKPIPLETIEQTIEEMVFYNNDHPPTDIWSLKDTFEDHQPSASTTTMPCAVSQERNSKPEVCVLPINFSPHPYSVICGRGKVRTDTPGNRYLQSVAGKYMQKYSQAQHSRKEKSSIVSNILQMVRDVCPDGRGAFIRAEKNRWIELSEIDARDKITSVMRSGLQSEYKSSTQSKVAKRRLQNKALKKDEEIRIEDGWLSPDMAFSTKSKVSIRWHQNKARKEEMGTQLGPHLSLDMAFCEDYHKEHPVFPTSKCDDEGFEDLLFGVELCMERFFEERCIF
jgi:hypothetical protein